MTTSFSSARNTTPPPPPPFQPTPSADRKYIVSPDCAGTRPTPLRSGHELYDIVRQNDPSTPWLPVAAAHKDQAGTRPKATSSPPVHTSLQEEMPWHQHNTAPTKHLSNIGELFCSPAGLRPLSVQRPDQAHKTSVGDEQPLTCTKSGVQAGLDTFITDINNHPPPNKGDNVQAAGTQKLVVGGTHNNLFFLHPSQNSSQASAWIPASSPHNIARCVPPIPRKNVLADDNNKIPSAAITRPTCTVALLSDQQQRSKEFSLYLRDQTSHDGVPRSVHAVLPIANAIDLAPHTDLNSDKTMLMAAASSTVRSKPPPPAYTAYRALCAPVPHPPHHHHSLAPPIPLSYPWGGGNPSAATHHRRVSSNGILDEELLRGVFAELMSFADSPQSPSAGGTNLLLGDNKTQEESVGRREGEREIDSLGVYSYVRQEEKSPATAAQMIASRNDDCVEKMEVDGGKCRFNFTGLTPQHGDHQSQACETPLPLKNRPSAESGSGAGSHVAQMEGSASSNSAASNRSQNSRNVDHRNALQHHCHPLDFRQDVPSHPPPQEAPEHGQESGLRMTRSVLPEECLIKLYHPFESSPSQDSSYYQNETPLRGRGEESNPHSYCSSNTCTNNNNNNNESNTNNPLTSFSLSSSCSYSQGPADVGPHTPRPPLAAVARRSPIMKSSRAATPMELVGGDGGDSIEWRRFKPNFRPKPPQPQATSLSAIEAQPCVVHYSVSSPSLLPAPKGATPLLPLPLRRCQNDDGKMSASVVVNTSPQQQQQHSLNPTGAISTLTGLTSARPPLQLSVVPDVVMAGTLATPLPAPQVSTVLANLQLTTAASSSASSPNRGKKGVLPKQPVHTKVVIGLALPSKPTGATSTSVLSADTTPSMGRPRSRRERRRDARLAVAAAAAAGSPSQPQIGSDRSDSPATDPVAEQSLPLSPLKDVHEEAHRALHPAAVMPISISQLPPPGYAFIQCVERVSTYETIVRVCCVPETLLI